MRGRTDVPNTASARKPPVADNESRYKREAVAEGGQGLLALRHVLTTRAASEMRRALRPGRTWRRWGDQRPHLRRRTGWRARRGPGRRSRHRGAQRSRSRRSVARGGLFPLTKRAVDRRRLDFGRQLVEAGERLGVAIGIEQLDARHEAIGSEDPEQEEWPLEGSPPPTRSVPKFVQRTRSASDRSARMSSTRVAMSSATSSRAPMLRSTCRRLRVHARTQTRWSGDRRTRSSGANAAA